jgi:hypothetical protein
MTIRLPAAIHEHLRREAFEARTSMTAIIAETLAARYEHQEGPKCAQCEHPGTEETLYSWVCEGKRCYICRDSVACGNRLRRDEQ